jgi:predicted DNA-binding transcriptional regulator AlpA
MTQSISIPDNLKNRITQLVQINGGDLDDFLVDLLESALDKKSQSEEHEPSWDQLSPRALVSPKQVSERLLFSQSKLAKLRCSGTGPKFVKLGSRTVAYRVKDVDSYIQSLLQFSTSESH